jgi:hypothetical protein
MNFYFTISLEKVGVHLYIQNISIQLNAVLFIIYVHPVTNILFFLTISKLKILSISSFNEISNKDNTLAGHIHLSCIIVTFLKAAEKAAS